MMRKTLLFFILTALGCSVVQAQTQSGTLLPEIDPQDIEIRGDFRARFANLIRQPILGFTNNQRLYALDPNRLPFMESEQQIRASLPIDDLERPIAPTRRRIIYPQRTNIYARGGFGRFNSPEVNVALEAPVSSTLSIIGGATYDGGSGHLDVNSAYRLLNIQAGVSAKVGERGNLRILGSLNDDFNDTNNPAIQKEYQGGGLKAQYRHVTNTLTHTDITAGYDFFKVGANISDFSNEEHRLTARSTTQWAGNRINDIFLVHARADAGIGSRLDGTDQNWSVLGVMPSYQTRSNYNSRLTLGGRLYYGTDDTGSRAAIYPDVKAEFFAIPSVVITGHMYGETSNKGLDGMHVANRFSGLDLNLQNERNWIADGRIDLQLFNAITLFGGINYRISTKYGYFQKRPIQLDASLYDVFYDDDARILNFQAGAQVTVIPSVLTLHGKIYNQTHKLSDGGKVPFLENSGIIAETQLTPFRRFAIKGWLHYVGDRETGFEMESLDGYILLNAQAEIMVAEQVGFYVKGLNLLGRDYELWKGYTERPLQVYGGVVIRL